MYVHALKHLHLVSFVYTDIVCHDASLLQREKEQEQKQKKHHMQYTNFSKV